MQTRLWEFGVKEAPAREWSEGLGSFIAVAMFCGGIAGGLYIASLFFNSVWGMLVAWIFALGMGLFDVVHLSKPMRVWRIAFRAGSSWISRGFILVILFIGAAGIQLLLHILTGAAYNEPTLAETIFRVAAGVFAFGVAVYSGFVVGFVNGIKFWNSALMPVLVVIGGLAGGSAILLAVATYTSIVDFGLIQNLARFTLVLYGASIFIHLWVSTYSSPVAKNSAKLLLSGNLAVLFWVVIILVGVVVPLIIESFFGSDSKVVLIVSAAMMLLGNLAFRYAIIKAGRYMPLVPA
jgi:formate-dependent nitrite reductase membrane component NrfD